MPTPRAGPASHGCSAGGIHLGRPRRFARRDLVLLVDCRAPWRLDRSREQRVVGLPHPRPKTPGQRLADSASGGIVSEVLSFPGIEDEIVELLARDDPLPPAALHPEVLDLAVVA